jgi:P2 family phage contractile tail tube protein
MLPHKLKNFRTFVDGDNYAGVAKDIATPKISVAGEDYRGAGMLGPVTADLGLEKLELEETYGGIVPKVAAQLGNPAADGSMVRFVGAYQSDEDGSVKAAELVVRGRLTELDPGTAEAGKDTEWKVKRACSYLKWIVDGQVLVEIDLVGMVYVVGGVDRMKDIRAALEG